MGGRGLLVGANQAKHLRHRGAVHHFPDERTGSELLVEAIHEPGREHPAGVAELEQMIGKAVAQKQPPHGFRIVIGVRNVEDHERRLFERGQHPVQVGRGQKRMLLSAALLDPALRRLKVQEDTSGEFSHCGDNVQNGARPPGKLAQQLFRGRRV